MEQQRVKKSFVCIIILLFLSMLSGWKCTQELSRSPQILSQEPQQQKSYQKPTSSRFGAIRYTYADVYAQPDVNSERLTQCIYGDVLRIDQENGCWYSVKIGPYPELSGWINKSAIIVLASNAQYIKERNLTTIVIRQDMIHAFIWPSTMMKIVMGTELPFIGESGKWYLVRLPSNDVARIARDAVYPSITSQPLIYSKQKPLPVPPQKVPRQRRDIVTTAQKFLGKVYIWGGTTPRGFDCSGLSYFVYKLNGIELPRISWLQFDNGFGQRIKRSELKQGDLVFFQTYRRGASHVGIYIGNNQFIHASPQYGVTTSNLDDPYFRRRYVGAKTIFSKG
jgi:hypothetical protein